MITKDSGVDAIIPDSSERAFLRKADKAKPVQKISETQSMPPLISQSKPHFETSFAFCENPITKRHLLLSSIPRPAFYYMGSTFLSNYIVSID